MSSTQICWVATLCFHTHPYSRLFRTELGFMSPADLIAMSMVSFSYNIDWHVIVEQYGFECVRTVPQKPMIKLLNAWMKALKKKDKKGIQKANKEINKAFKEHQNLHGCI